MNAEKGRSSRTGASAGRESLTPAMRQYRDQKARVGDAILLFRMGDFYETFWDDAILASKVLGIALTSRNKGAANEIPLAGIPYHALDGYLKKLVRAGCKVAISEQLEDPKQAKGVVRRDVVRIVTAGTLTDESLLDERETNLLASICIRGHQAGVAWMELASGRFEVVEVAADALLDELVQHRPAELLLDDERDPRSEQVAEHLRRMCGTMLSRRPAHEFSAFQAEKSLLEHLGVATLAGFGLEQINPAVRAAGCIIQYLQETQKTALAHVRSIRRRALTDYVQIDHASRRALEIERTLHNGSREGTLLHAVDRTVHPIGGRTLVRWLRAPLTDPCEIIRRQDAVGWYNDESATRGRIRDRLKRMTDVERIAGRVALRRASARDLGGLGRSLDTLPALAEEISVSRVAFLTAIAGDFQGVSDVADLLRRAIHEEPPTSMLEGGFIADGFDEELDRLRSVARDGQSWLAEYQRKEMERTGIRTLKVGFNRVFGYYIEVSNSNREQVPPEYVRKQTIKSAERYITEELKRYETDVLTARDKAHQLETRLFEGVRDQVAGRVDALMTVAAAIGRLDCVAGLAELAHQRRYVRPAVSDEVSLEIRNGRHPVLDQTLQDGFVPNDTLMSGKDRRLFVITGPNMAGKSTYIRQVALLTLLAQTGSFVPAEAMTFSLTDRIFARVGASDEIMRGRSTFMVEMTEAANILHNATERSLVVLDELGRGTSTFDGLSLAWAITEHLATELRCRSLVATHYHEMTRLAELLEGVCNYHAAVREYPAAKRQEDAIVFLHRIAEGAASKSYGIHVAKLAGLPEPVIGRSKEVMAELERGFDREAQTPELTRMKTRTDSQLDLFLDPTSDVISELRSVEPDRMTPMDALMRIKEWKDRLGGA